MPFELSRWHGGRCRVRRHAGLPLTKLGFEWFRSYDRRMEFLGFRLASIQNVSLALSRKKALKSP
jgi:hypothetical protein